MSRLTHKKHMRGEPSKDGCYRSKQLEIRETLSAVWSRRRAPNAGTSAIRVDSFGAVKDSFLKLI